MVERSDQTLCSLINQRLCDSGEVNRQNRSHWIRESHIRHSECCSSNGIQALGRLSMNRRNVCEALDSLKDIRVNSYSSKGNAWNLI